MFHARAGQGAKTIAELLVEAALDENKFVQAWPNYGAERTGAPMMTFARISNKPIVTHAAMRTADVIVVLDPTLLSVINIKTELKPEAKVIVNYDNITELKKSLKLKNELFAINANEISKRLLGRNFPNIPLLGALIKVSNIVKFKTVQSKLYNLFAPKHGETVAEKNVMALREGFEKV